MKVLSKSSGGAFEPSPSPPLLLHDLISRQIHLSRATRIPQTEPGGRTGIHWNIEDEVDGAHKSLWSSASSSFFPPPRLRGEKTGWRVDFQAAGLSLRQRGCDPPGLHTTTASLERYAPPVDQSSAALSNPRPSDISIGRIQTRRRSKATRPGHPCTRVQERRAINHAYTSCTHHDQVLAAIKKSCSLRFLVYPRQRRFAIAEPTFFDRKRIVVSERGSMDGWIDKKVWSFSLPYILKQ